MDEELAFLPASELRELIAAKQVSPVEVTKLYFDRIERLDSRFNSYLTLTRDEAIKAAQAAEDAVAREEALGPLHGLPISIKDLEMTKGIRTTGGSLVFRERVPDEDSIVVERVRKAGGVILGKTNTPEFGLLGETRNRLGDHCRNPWNTERTTGGSSGGAGASVIAGLCSLATGSDGGGSIRIPCSFCGVYGIKPTQGRVPRYAGATAPVVANQTSQSGPMTRTVRDSAALLQVLAGYDPRDPSSLRDKPPDFLAALDQDIGGLRIAWSTNYGYSAVDPEVVEVTGKAAQVFEELGCSVEESDLKLDSPFDAFWTLFSTNAYASFGALLENQADQLTDYARECIEHGATVSGADYAKALGYIDRLKSQMADLFEDYDLLLSPAMAVPAFPVGQSPARIAGEEAHPFWGFLPFTFPINMVGHTAASIPCGFSSDGMPIGLHMVGRRGGEETVIAASAAFERAKPWIEERPAVS
ncbi:MAG: amidase [Dehalococcoidia bacterium]